MGIRNEPEHQAEPSQAVPDQAPASTPALGSGPLSVARVQALQRSAGNAAVTALLRDAAAPAPAAPAATSLIAEDDVAELAPGQARRREFLTELRGQVEAVLDEVIEGVLLRLAAQATLSRWLADAQAKTAPELERAILDFVPAATGATSARGYFAPILARVRAEAVTWQGEQAEEGPALLPKLSPGAPPPDSHDPSALADKLGGGRPLEPEVGAQFGGVLGRELSQVRVHDDAAGAKVAGEVGARAVAIGEHIAFAPGEYRPGTPVGDALLAHELAHVGQQADARVSRSSEPDSALERDADEVAVGAVAGLWGLRRLARTALPRLRSGLRLQSCNGGSRPAPAGPGPVAVPTTRGPDQHAGARELDAATQRDVLNELSPGSFAPAPPVPAGGGPVVAPPTRIEWDGQSTNPAHVANRAALKRDLNAALVAHLNGVMVGIRAEAARPRLPVASFEGPGRAAKTTVDLVFGHLKAAAALSAAARHGVTFTASGAGRNLFDANDPADRALSGAPISARSVAFWMAIHDPVASGHVQTHHFDPETAGSESSVFMRDEILTPFVTARRADLELYDLWGFALAPDGAGVGRTVATPTTLNAGLSTAAGAGGAPSPAERATRWSAWQTLVHEYIHTLAHPAWDGATSAGGGVMNEGFCEMFTAEILDAQIAAIRNDAGVRTEVEGNATTPPPNAAILPTTYTSPSTYQADRAHAETIRTRLGANAVRAAYFQGHIEFIGLQPGGAPATPVAAADQCAVPRGVSTLAQLAAASGLTEAEIRAANPTETFTGALPARLGLPGARDHRIVGVSDAGAAVIETRAQIASQNGVSEADLVRANPGIADWTRLADGDRVLVPKH